MFFVIAFFAGIVSHYCFSESTEAEIRKFDYNIQDSLFYSYGTSELTDTVENFVQKKVDSDRELLDFSRNKNKLEDSAGSDSKLSRMNLNTAGIPDLIKLPGIGNKTAEKILEYRKSHGGFKKIEELLNVKGIGKAKFRKIKQYLFID